MDKVWVAAVSAGVSFMICAGLIQWNHRTNVAACSNAFNRTVEECEDFLLAVDNISRQKNIDFLKPYFE